MKINEVLDFLRNYDGKRIRLMEVCGTHTASIAQNAIPSLISDKIELISGPGCPVCVTVSDYTDRLIDLALSGNVIITFGDMIRVPGSKRALQDIKADGADIRMVYSPIQALDFARSEPEKEFVFAAVGFETTTPIYALLIDEMLKKDIKNLRLLTALKTMPRVIEKVCEISDNGIDGFLAPGHVCAITGSDLFIPLAKKYKVPFVVSGFEAEEIIGSIYALIKMQDKGEVLNLYKSTVKSEPNAKANDIVSKYFEKCDAAWRGLGIIEDSGMGLKEEYSRLDAGSKELTNDESQSKGCRCGEIITGRAKPTECPLYKKACTPENPMGACMVSTEGTCFNYYTNNRE